MRRDKREEKKIKNAADLGIVPHHTGCPADTTNSPARVCGGDGLLKDVSLIPGPASSDGLEPTESPS